MARPMRAGLPGFSPGGVGVASAAADGTLHVGAGPKGNHGAEGAGGLEPGSAGGVGPEHAVIQPSAVSPGVVDGMARWAAMDWSVTAWTSVSRSSL